VLCCFDSVWKHRTVDIRCLNDRMIPERFGNDVVFEQPTLRCSQILHSDWVTVGTASLILIDKSMTKKTT